MLESGLPEQFYGRAMHTASVALNAHPTIDDPVHANTTPFAVMFPNRTQPKLRVFGSLAYVLNTPKKSRKDNLKLPGSIGWFIGYSDHSSGYLVYDPITHVIKIRRDVTFDERWRYDSFKTQQQLLDQIAKDDALRQYTFDARPYLPPKQSDQTTASDPLANTSANDQGLSLIHIYEPTRPY